jgi:hypothetical protein
MGLVDKPAFGAGELDPALWERTNLEKYRTGMAIARNWIVSKTGSLLTRNGRQFVAETKLVDREVILYSPPGGGVLLEWGHQYVRVYSLLTSPWSLIGDIAHSLLESDLTNIHFETSGSYVYIFCAGKNILKFNYSTGIFTGSTSIFAVPPAPSTHALVQAGTPAGYNVEYAFTYVLKGEESLPYYTGAAGKLPVASGQTQTVTVTLAPTAPTTNLNPYITEMRAYRRPSGASGFGFVGSSSTFTTTGGLIKGVFIDVGQDADYTHQPPQSLMQNDPTVALPTTEVPDNPIDPGQLLSNTGVIYQQRLIITDYVTDLEALYASQPGYQDNFYRNFPLDSASALKFKCGTSGYARILRLLDSDGLVAFTAAGIFLNQGELTPDNISMQKKGRWVINPSVPPRAIPGGVMFIDSATNGVRNLLWSLQLNAFDAEEISIYSNHLFRTKVINAWDFQVGYFPLLWTVFGDGTFASFTYEYNQQMQAWTRHDGALPVKYVTGSTFNDNAFFTTLKLGNDGHYHRYIEATIPRYVPPLFIQNDPNYDKNPTCAFMDGITSYTGLLSGTMTFTTTVTEDWTQPLNLNSSTAGAFSGVSVNDILRFFIDDGSVIDVEVTAKVDNQNVTVELYAGDDVFDQDWATGQTIYKTAIQMTGLNYLEAEDVSVIVDGAVVASPNNDVDNYPTITVSLGVMNLPTGIRGAIIHVGRPIVADLQTLDIDTVEQQPALIESLTNNKVYVKVKDAKGLFVGNKFPVEQTDDNGAIIISGDGVSGMDSIDTIPVDYEQDNPIIGNRAMPSQTRRYEVVMAGDYRSQGRICVRQVDPLHAEILSFIPDIEVLKRSDR